MRVLSLLSLLVADGEKLLPGEPRKCGVAHGSAGVVVVGCGLESTSEFAFADDHALSAVTFLLECVSEAVVVELDGDGLLDGVELNQEFVVGHW